MPAASSDPSPMNAEALFRAHARFVAGFLMRLGVPAQEVDDLVQEVFMTAHRKGGYQAGSARPTTWLAEIALRVVSTRRRTNRRKQVELDGDAVERAVSDATDPCELASQRQTLTRVQRALDALELERRAVFVLYELEGESCDAIAAGLGIPVGTVYSRLHTARREFLVAYERPSPSLPRARHQGPTP